MTVLGLGRGCVFREALGLGQERLDRGRARDQQEQVHASLKPRGR